MRRCLIGLLAFGCVTGSVNATEILCHEKSSLTSSERAWVKEVEHIWPRLLLETLNAADPQRWRKLTNYGAPKSPCTPIRAE